MTGWPVVPGVPAAGHVARNGYWHPGRAHGCHRPPCPQATPPPRRSRIPSPVTTDPPEAPMPSQAAQTFLDRESPVTAALRPFAAGEAEWETTRDALAAIDYVPARSSATPEQLMGRDGGVWAADRELDPDVAPGSWAEVTRAVDLGIITSAQVAEVFTARTGTTTIIDEGTEADS